MAIIQGDLAEYAVPDLLQFMHASRKQGQLLLQLRASTQPAGVFFHSGEVIHAYCPPKVGVNALYALLGWREGRFAFLKDAAAPERTIHDGLQNILLEGLRRLDEYRVIAERLPAPDTVLHLSRESEGEADIRLTRGEWKVLSLVNGRRTLREVMEGSQRAEDEGARMVYGLLVAGLVTTVSDDRWLDRIVPARIPAAEAPPQRGAPPTILANLLLKRVDGVRTLAALRRELGCTERDLGEELRLLVRTGWVRLVRGADLFERWAGG